jgi:hypothetical protein
VFPHVRCGVDRLLNTLPRTKNPGAVIDPGMIPITPLPAGVAPFLCTITSSPFHISFQAKWKEMTGKAILMSPFCFDYVSEIKRIDNKASVINIGVKQL